jgi:hypothetical protein
MSACTSISSERARSRRGEAGRQRRDGRRPRAGAPALLVLLAGVVATIVLELHGAAGCVPSDACLRESDCDPGLACIDGTCQAPPADTSDGGASTLDASADGGDAGDAGDGSTDGGDASADAGHDGGDASDDGGDASADGGDAGQGGAGGAGGHGGAGGSTTTTTSSTGGAGGATGAGGTGGSAGFGFP